MRLSEALRARAGVIASMLEDEGLDGDRLALLGEGPARVPSRVIVAGRERVGGSVRHSLGARCEAICPSQLPDDGGRGGIC